MLDNLYAAPFNLALGIFLLGCVVLDLLFGDPKDWPHPVRLIGAGLNALEGWGRGFLLGPFLGGAASVLGITMLTGLVAWWLTALPLIGELLALYLGYAGLALGCLVRETAAVTRLLEHNKLDQARTLLAGLVSRDTTHMDRNEMYRAVGETLAENFNDGFVAPFFYLAFFGPVALWMYKAISTADSMWGYRCARFEQVGKAGARLDDILAWIPARLSAVAIWLAGWLCLRPASWTRISTEARTMASPNAGWPMSALAHTAGVSMGGATRYNGGVADKPLLGPHNVPWSGRHLERMRRIMLVAAGINTILLTGLGSWLELWTLST